MNMWKRPSKRELEKLYKKRLYCILANPPNQCEYYEGLEIINSLSEEAKLEFKRRLEFWFYRRK